MKSRYRNILPVLTILAAILYSLPLHAATTLLPNGKQCFTIGGGLPAISGSLNMFFVGTSNPKATWQDGNQVSLNSQPIQLDSQGCAIIYGIGSYRQQLFDGPVVGGATSGNLIWDQTTTDTSAFNAVFWAGIAGGTPNVITVVDTGFNGTDGSVINFTALATNTGGVTINPSGFGNVSVVKDTASGPLPLTGGEIVQNNTISVIYSASGNVFHLLNTSIATASGNASPLCGANNLKIQNSVATPNTIITVTADDAVMTNPSGIVVNRSNVNVSINISTGTVTSTAGGMDGEATGVNAWLYIWLIDNGVVPGGLTSAAAGNGLTPSMPSGYTFKCRIGAMRVDAASVLLRTLQRGAMASYTVISPSNTPSLPLMANGAAGNPGAGTYVAVPINNFVAPTASEILFTGLTAQPNGIIVAPNANYGAINSANPPPYSTVNQPAGAVDIGILGHFLIETPCTAACNIYWANTGAGILFAKGWKDQVNAN